MINSWPCCNFVMLTRNLIFKCGPLARCGQCDRPEFGKTRRR